MPGRSRYAERLLREDPLREATYRLLMRLHDARGDRARALRAYHACAATLERELGVEPSAATRGPTRRCCRPAPSRPPAGGGTGRAARPAARWSAGTPERARLTGLWRAAEGGGAQLVLVTGEPGVGKTRLVEEFRAWCAHRGAATAEARSYPAEGALAYGPVVAWLRSEPLAGHLGRLDPARLAELARLLPELRPARARPPRARAAARRATSGGGCSTRSPGRCWPPAGRSCWSPTTCTGPTARPCSSSTTCCEPSRGAPLLVVATARREELDPEHPLHDLADRAAGAGPGRRGRGRAALRRRRRPRSPSGCAGGPLDAAEADRLFAETEGNPLFVVEALRAGWSGQRPARPGHPEGPGGDRVPPGPALRPGPRPGRRRRDHRAGVHHRRARRGQPGRRGRRWSRGLDELWRRRLVRDQGPDAYDFTHDRIREVAYLGLSPARRRRTHLLVARALERLHAGDPAPVAAQVAAHHERAGAADRGGRLVPARRVGGPAAARLRRGGPPARARPPAAPGSAADPGRAGSGSWPS